MGKKEKVGAETGEMKRGDKKQIAIDLLIKHKGHVKSALAEYQTRVGAPVSVGPMFYGLRNLLQITGKLSTEKVKPAKAQTRAKKKAEPAVEQASAAETPTPEFATA